MMNILISYNPYTVKTELSINDKKIDEAVSNLAYISDKRLQEWIDPRGSWRGIFKELFSAVGDKNIKIDFVGTYGDFDDLVYAKDKYGDCFENIELNHANKDSAKEADPYNKMLKLRELYAKLQDGPVEEFKTEDIRENFDKAINTEFKIVIVAPMSSGKSTLINAILGRDLLPAVNQATTAVITEIKDNDSFEDFLVSADDKYGKNVVASEKATKELISELNYLKDDNDPEGKEALIHRIQIEGPVPNLPSDALNTVFVDTPGGNNSQNEEHEMMMDDAIEDENKSLILYVFNGAQLGTNDSNIILQKISNTMENSVCGKQSRDRFLFVANRMDEYDIEKESYEQVINDTILVQLANNGITEPNLFLASAQTAKLIRMTDNGENLSETEEENFDTFLKRFNKESRRLSNYASLSSVNKEKLDQELLKYTELRDSTNDINEKEAYKRKIAEINSGVPAIELAIKEYLEKYAISIKIKNVHDTFMKKVEERQMMDKCIEECNRSQKEYDATMREITDKENTLDNSKKMQDYRNKVNGIKLDTKPIKIQQAKITKLINDLANNGPTQVKKEQASYYLSQFNRDINRIKNDISSIEFKMKTEIKEAYDKIVDEYRVYINELEKEGFFRLGNFDLKKTQAYKNFGLTSSYEYVDSKYKTQRDVKVGTEKVKKKGFIPFLARVFGSEEGYEEKALYERQEFFCIKRFIEDKVTEIQHAFDLWVKQRIEETENELNEKKNETIGQLNELDVEIRKIKEEIKKKLKDKEALNDLVESNRVKKEFIDEFVGEVEGLLKI